MSTRPILFADRLSSSNSTTEDYQIDRAFITAGNNYGKTSINTENNCNASIETGGLLWKDTTNADSNKVSCYCICSCFCCSCFTSRAIHSRFNDMINIHTHCKNCLNSKHFYPLVHPSTSAYDTYNNASNRTSTTTTFTGDTSFFSMDNIMNTTKISSSPLQPSKATTYQQPLFNNVVLKTTLDVESAQNSLNGITGSIQHNHLQESPLQEEIPRDQVAVKDQLYYEVIDREAEVEKEEDCSLQENEFFKLLSMLIQHAESLEWITADLLRTENKVRELKSLERSISEGYDYREKFYLDRLTEYEQILKLQTSMIDDLSELERDLHIQYDLSSMQRQNGSIRTELNKIKSHLVTKPLSNVVERNIEASYFHQCRDNCKGSTKSSSNNSTHNGSYFPSTNFEDKQQLSSMNDIAHKIRWKTAKWIGGSVSTCQVVYSFNRPRDVPEFIIAGSGTINSFTVTTSSCHMKALLPTTTKLQPIEVYITPPTTLSNSLQRYHYLLHINAHDQNTLFRLLPKRYWIPDADSLTCQFQSCTTSFSFFQRRHHCRRCGILVCQEHSLNRLPLFSPQEQHHLSLATVINAHSNANINYYRWYRVCDTCFFDLIIARSPATSAIKNIPSHRLSAVDSAADLSEVSGKQDLLYTLQSISC